MAATPDKKDAVAAAIRTAVENALAQQLGKLSADIAENSTAIAVLHTKSDALLKLLQDLALTPPAGKKGVRGAGAAGAAGTPGTDNTGTPGTSGTPGTKKLNSMQFFKLAAAGKIGDDALTTSVRAVIDAKINNYTQDDKSGELAKKSKETAPSEWYQAAAHIIWNGGSKSKTSGFSESEKKEYKALCDKHNAENSTPEALTTEN